MGCGGCVGCVGVFRVEMEYGINKEKRGKQRREGKRANN